MKPRFSVVVPTYNREKIVGPTIDSVLAQTFADYELIVVDDGSTDRTWEVLQSYGARIKAIRQKNQGPEVARGAGAALANGEYIAFMDSDDLLLPYALATYDQIIRACDSPALIIGALTFFEDGQTVQASAIEADGIEVWRCRDYLAKDVSVGLYGSNMVTKKSVLEQAGGFRQSTATTFYMDNIDTILRLGVYGPCVIVKQPITVAYRVHATNSIHDVEAMISGMPALIEAERNGRYPGGRSRRFARYACLGGIGWCWCKHALRAGRPGLAFKLLLECAPMVAAGALKKIQIRIRGTSSPVRLTTG
jgi:GT2 family glycosyltransferase